jgi:hypothetical protein
MGVGSRSRDEKGGEKLDPERVPFFLTKMNKYRAAYVIQRAWISYVTQRVQEFSCHPGPFCGDWVCPGDCNG